MGYFQHEQQKQLIKTLPFPLSYLYQRLLAQQSFFYNIGKTEDEEYSLESLFWMLRANYRLLTKFIAIIATCDYLYCAKDEQSGDFAINKFILEHLQPGKRHWLCLAEKIIDYFHQRPEVFRNKNKVPELLQLLTEAIFIQKAPPDNFASYLLKNQAYSWFEVMECFWQLEDELFVGRYRFIFPSSEKIDFYIYLLEILLWQCQFLSKYGIYILVGKDERKARGFLCRGNRAHAVSVRGISSAAWTFLKGRPFLCLLEQKKYLPLFPFMAPFLQKRKGRTAFRDLLIFDYYSKEKLLFYGYRLKKLLSHEKCSQSTLGMWQREQRWLTTNTHDSDELQQIFCFDSLTEYHARYFVGRESTLNAIAQIFKNYPHGYFYLRGKAGSGKTSIFSHLYQCWRSGNLSCLHLHWQQNRLPIIAWHFCSQLADRDNPIAIMHSLYMQILQQLDQGSVESIAGGRKKLPMALENVQKTFIKLLKDVSGKLNQRSLVVVLDGLDEANFAPASLTTLASCLPTHLPKNVFFLLSWRNSSPNSLLKNYQQDGLPIRTCADDTPFQEIHSPLGALDSNAIDAWVAKLEIPEQERDQVAEIAWTKSQGDPMYLSLLGDAYRAGYVDFCHPSLIPATRYQFFAQYWQKLQIGGIEVCKLLGLLAHLKEYGHDAIFATILDCPLEQIERQRWRLNAFLCYHQDRYSFRHSLLRNYICCQFSPEDRQEFHNLVAKSYHSELGYKHFSNQAFSNLAYHYYKSRNWDKLYALCEDDSFKEEKIRCLKEHRTYLYDISLAMQASYQQKSYATTLRLGYRYCQVVQDARRGIAQGFHAAANGNYLLALERIRAIRDEQDLFKALMIILAYALYNNHGEEARAILQECARVSEDQIGYLALGMEPYLIFILKKFRHYKLERIDYLIGKHGLWGKEAVLYLLELHCKIEFTSYQLPFFIQKLIANMGEISSAEEQRAILRPVLSLWLTLNETMRTKVWQELLSFINNIENVAIRLEALKDLAIATVCSENVLPQYTAKLAQAAEHAMGIEHNKALSLGQYASLLRILGNSGKAQAIADKMWTMTEHASNKEKIILALLEISIPSKANISLLQARIQLPQSEWNKLWNLWATFSSRERQPLAITAATALIRSGDSRNAFEFLQSELHDHPSYAHIVTKLLKIANAEVQYLQPIQWQTLIRHVSDINICKHYFDLLLEIGVGILTAGDAEENSVWDLYVAACERLIHSPFAHRKDELLRKFSYNLAQKGFLAKSKQIIGIISNSNDRNKALTQLAIHSIKSIGKLEIGFETLDEVHEAQNDLQLLACIAEHILPGDPGRAYWRNLTNYLRNIEWDDTSCTSDFVSIIRKLFADLPLDESFPFWQDVFTAIHAMTSIEDKLHVLQIIVDELARAESLEKTISFWPLFTEILHRFHSYYGKARLQANIATALAHLGEVVEANQYLEQAFRFAVEEENPVLALEAMAAVAFGYRELGKEGSCRKILEDILIYSGVKEKKKIRNWDPERYLIYLAELGLEDFALILAEKLLLANVEKEVKAPSSNKLADIANLCLDAEQNEWARCLVFRIFPSLSREPTISTETPLYLKVIQLIDRMENFTELWEHTEEMVPNLPHAGMQEQCLEALATSLSNRDSYENLSYLWDKLRVNADYVGGSLESLRSLTRIVKSSTTVAPWPVVQNDLVAILEKVDNISSEYDKVRILEIIAEILLFFPEEQRTPLWNQLVNLAQKCCRKECEGLILMGLSKAVAKQARLKNQQQLFQEAAQLIHKIPRLPQKCEGYLALAKEYQQARIPHACKENLETIVKKEKMLGAFYQNKLLPETVDLLLELQEIDLAFAAIEPLEEQILKIRLYFQLVAYWQRHENNSQARSLLQRILSEIKTISPQNGDRSKMYALAAIYAYKLSAASHFQSLFNKAFASWRQIEGSSYQKETIAFIIEHLQTLPIEKNLLPVLQKLYECANHIEQETYRFWALKEVVVILARFRQFKYVLEVVNLLPPASEIKAHVLKIYAREAPMEDSLTLLKILDGEEQIIFSKEIADKLEHEGDLENLMRLWITMPGNFSLLCHFSVKILSLALKNKGKECFTQWFLQIAPAWGIVDKDEVIL